MKSRDKVGTVSTVGRQLLTGQGEWAVLWVNSQFLQPQGKENSCWKVGVSAWLGHYALVTSVLSDSLQPHGL